MTIGNWNGYTFVVSPELIRGFNGLSIKSSCETSDKTGGKQKYAEYTAAQPSEISLTVQLNALTGVTDVRGEALMLADAAMRGVSAYFYIGDSKLVPCKVMLTSATIDNVEMAGTTWICCEVKLSFKQSDKGELEAESAKKSKKRHRGKDKDDSILDTAIDVANGIIDAAKGISRNIKQTWASLSVTCTKAVIRSTAQRNTGKSTPPTTGRVSTTGGAKRSAMYR